MPILLFWKLMYEITPIMEKMNQNLSYQRGVLDDKKAALQQTKVRLLTKGFNKTQVQCVFIPIKMDVAQEIQDLQRQRVWI